MGVVYSDTELIDPYDTVIESSVWRLYTQKPIVGGGDAMFKMCSEPAGNPALNSTIMIRAELAVAGVDLTTVPDALLVGKGAANAKSPAKAIKVELERRADALLTRRPARLGVQAYGPERMSELKAGLATRDRA